MLDKLRDSIGLNKLLKFRNSEALPSQFLLTSSVEKLHYLSQTPPASSVASRGHRKMDE